MTSGGDAAGDTIFNFENLLGSSQADSLFGDGLANVLTGGAGDDFLFGGLNNEVFAFGSGFGHDTILDFTPGGDDIRFLTTVFASFDQVMANAAQVGTDVVITKDINNTSRWTMCCWAVWWRATSSSSSFDTTWRRWPAGRRAFLPRLCWKRPACAPWDQFRARG